MKRNALFKIPKTAVGVVSSLEHAWAFHDWAIVPGQAVTHETIMARWGVSRATAYRWLAAWNATLERRAA